MEPGIIRLAFWLQTLIDAKHQYTRSLDLCTRQLVKAITSRHKAPATPLAPVSTLADYQAKLSRLSVLIFDKLSVSPPSKSSPTTLELLHDIQAVVRNVEVIAVNQTDRLDYIADRVS